MKIKFKGWADDIRIAQTINERNELLEALQELLLLHNYEMEGKPSSPNQWYEAVKKGEKAIEKVLK
ncbi:MAG: hypothetical protein ACOVSR_09770 [Bacteroidia bacterium]